MIYLYKIINIPNLDSITEEINLSSMVNKEIFYMTWDEETQILKIIFLKELSESDLNILNSIVSNY